MEIRPYNQRSFYERALQIGQWIFGCLAVLHLAAFLALPYLPGLGAYLWGGRTEMGPQLLVLEAISVGVLMGGWTSFWILHRSGNKGWRKAASIAISIYSLLFVLNTLGNLLAKTNLERSFSLVTFFLAALCGWVGFMSFKKAQDLN